MFCSAIEKPKVAAEMPRSSVIGRMNRPRLWRSPMQIEMMSPLSAIRTSMARRFWMAVIVNRSGYLSSGLAYTPVKPLSTQTCVERILAAADGLFYAKGIRAVGVDAVAAAAGVSKRTLYNHYPSKDALIAAYLQGRFKHIAPSDAPAREQILGAFDRLERMFADGSFRGCPYVNAVTEIDRKSTRLNSSHGYISYAVFCLKKKKTKYAYMNYK